MRSRNACLATIASTLILLSVPTAQGKTGIYFYDTNCAFTGGCVP